MARIPLIDPDDPGADPVAREALGVLGGMGAPNVLRALANHPRLMRGFGMAVYSPEARITPAQRELAYLTASVVNSCHY